MCECSDPKCTCTVLARKESKGLTVCNTFYLTSVVSLLQCQRQCTATQIRSTKSVHDYNQHHIYKRYRMLETHLREY